MLSSCCFELDTTHADVAASGGAIRSGVTAMTGCAWTARALDPWVSITGGVAGLLEGVALSSCQLRQYRGGHCKHIEGQRVIVAGQRKSDGRVSADQIDLNPK